LLTCLLAGPTWLKAPQSLIASQQMSIGELLCGRGTYALDCYVLHTQSRRARVVRRNLCCLFAVVPEMMTDILPLYGNNAGIMGSTRQNRGQVTNPVSQEKCGGANVLLLHPAAWNCYNIFPTYYPSSTTHGDFDMLGVRLSIV
jgi:hypothetical protein